MNVLVFAPHPDDDLLGCGGSIIKHIAAGNEVSIIYFTSGEAGGHATDKLGEIREEEAKEATTMIGIPRRNLYFLRQTDGYLMESIELLVVLTDLIRTLRPDVVYLPHAHDNHPDHIKTSQIGLKALEKAAMTYGHKKPWAVDTILAYEVWTPIEEPNYFEETTAVIGQKIKALRAHKSQLSLITYDDMALSLGLYRGVLLGKQCYAEAFCVLRIPQSSITNKSL